MRLKAVITAMTAGISASPSGTHTYTGIISGWYAPAMNIHRTPFAGRNFEYYSEDGFMSGELALEASRACAEKGVYAYIKLRPEGPSKSMARGLLMAVEPRV